MENNIFFIVGAQRCGTSWLYNCLNSHPSVLMLGPVAPEPKYFLKDSAEISKDDYLSLFDDHNRDTLIGEKSTTYIESFSAATKIKSFFPKAKIIICLRNPVERALSNYFYSKGHGLETRTLEQVFLEGITPPSVTLKNFSANPFAYTERGLYSTFIKRYLEIFSHSRILITFMENFTTDNEELQRIFDHLQVSLLSSPKGKFNSAPRTNEINPSIISKLKEYYKEDTKALIKNFKLSPPYADL